MISTDDAQHDAGRQPVADFTHKLAEYKAAVGDTVYAEAQHEVCCGLTILAGNGGASLMTRTVLTLCWG